MRTSERGALLVHVAVGLVALIAFSSLALDMGVLWAARNQIQTSADAGAMAGALARGYGEDPDDPPLATGVAYQHAVAAAKQNLVWGATPASFAVSWDRPNGVPANIQGKFVRVDVFRNGENGSAPLPTFFLQIVGKTTQGVKATATAVSAYANGVTCMKPWFIPDKWAEVTSPANQFNGGDYYIPPDSSTGTTGTGYQVPRDLGLEVTLKAGNPKQAINPSDFYAVDLTNPACASKGATGGECYRLNIETCSGVDVKIGDSLTVEPGNMVGPTKQGVEQDTSPPSLMLQDPNATWDSTNNTVINSNGARIVPIALFSPSDYMAQDRTSGRFSMVVVNIIGFFIEGINGGGDVTGRLVPAPGQIVAGTSVGPGANFLQKLILVR